MGLAAVPQLKEKKTKEAVFTHANLYKNIKIKRGIDKRLVIVGAGSSGLTIAGVLAQTCLSNIVGFVDDKMTGDYIHVDVTSNVKVPIPLLGKSSELLEILKKHDAQAVVVAVNHEKEDHLLSGLVQCYQEGILVYEMTALFEKLTQKIPLQYVDHHWTIPNLGVPENNFYTIFHDVTNYVLSLLGLFLVFVPLFPFVVLAIKLDTPGSVFYKQTRVGEKGKLFTLLKFRTMIQDADKKGTSWTLRDDERITRVGKWLRKYRLDELPQLINILIGDMNLIGPRPESSDLVETFKNEIPFYKYRYLVKPGISGWAQVNHGNTCSVEGALEKLTYDLYWIKHRSFWLDIKIIFKSIKVMVTGFGAV